MGRPRQPVSWLFHGAWACSIWAVRLPRIWSEVATVLPSIWPSDAPTHSPTQQTSAGTLLASANPSPRLPPPAPQVLPILKPPSKLWQPIDYLPAPEAPEFLDAVSFSAAACGW